MLHPRFPEAVRLHVQINLAICSEAPLAREILGNAARQLAFNHIGILSSRHALDASKPPLTRTRLKEALKPWGISHHGKIDSLVDRLIDLELIATQRLPSDLRSVVLRPTDAFFAMYEKYIAPYVLPAVLLAGEELLASFSLAGPGAAMRLRAFGGYQVENAIGMLQRVPQMWAFIRHDAGWLILFVLLDAIWRQDDAARKPVAIARFLGVSRPHVRNVLMSAFELGLLEESSPGLMAPTAELSRTVDIWVAELLASIINFVRTDLSP